MEKALDKLEGKATADDSTNQQGDQGQDQQQPSPDPNQQQAPPPAQPGGMPGMPGM
jgi:hypothetical protein